MSDDATDEPDVPQSDDGDDTTSEQRDQADPAEHPFFRSSVFDSMRARIEEQQRLVESALKGVGGFDGLQWLFNNVLPRAEALNAQQRTVERALKGVGGFDGLQQILNNFLPQTEAFRQFTGSVIPQLIKFPPLNLPVDWFPHNWQDVPDDDIGKAVDIILDEGIPLVWVPRPAIVAELVGASDGEARDDILLSSRDDIADDCLTVLGEVTVPDLKPLAELAADAVNALRSRHDSSAQALAGNIFDTLLRDAARRGVIFAGPPVGYFKYDKVRKQITPVSDGTLIRRFRADCVLSAALRALEEYDPSDPPPARFVRHATAHRACPAQYTPVNAIVAVMLAASMLREAQASGW